MIGPHAGAKKVLVQPYPFSPFCPDKTEDCMVSPYEAIAALNVGGSTTTAPGVDRARSHCRFVLPLIHFIPDSLIY